ncbi:MAG TPA: sigma-70 family RNA polymerase sigma factor [Abditibacteriaceae bacterium]|jgi:RNA polymerase sigma-70 factor (ECF subfamily)
MRLPFLPGTKNQTEAQLLERCRAGDLEAFDDLMARHQNRVFSLCLWLLRDHDAASDAAQETFIRAFRAIGNFRGECAVSTWLHRIAVNVAGDSATRRKRAAKPLSELETDDSPAPEAVAPLRENPLETLARNERQQAVRKALDELSEHHRTVLVLFDIQGHSYEDIAQVLELPIGTVKSRLNRARAALRERLETCRELFET